MKIAKRKKMTKTSKLKYYGFFFCVKLAVCIWSINILSEVKEEAKSSEAVQFIDYHVNFHNVQPDPTKVRH